MLQIEWEKTSKSKQGNTAIFGAKNIDLLELCTTNNNNFGATTNIESVRKTQATHTNVCEREGNETAAAQR